MFQASNQVDARGYFILENQTIVTIRFTRIDGSRFEGFNRQNVIASLDVAPLDTAAHGGRRFRVEMPSLYGLDASFECERIVVVDSRPWRVGANAPLNP